MPTLDPNIKQFTQQTEPHECHRCLKLLPPTTNPRDWKANILWSHQGIPCSYTDEERYS